MKRTSFILVIILLAAFCATSDTGAWHSVPTGEQWGLTFETVRHNAVVALSQPGQVYHATEAKSERGYQSVTDVWLDLERDLAREEGGYWGLRVYHDDKVAELAPGEGRFVDSGLWPAPGLGRSAALSLDYIVPLFDQRIESTGVRVLDVGGERVIQVEVVTPFYTDYAGTETTRVYLDGDFLPLYMSEHLQYGLGGRGSAWSRDIEAAIGDVLHRLGISEVPGNEMRVVRYADEFVPRESLDEGFFSPEAVRATEVTPTDNLARVAATGFKLYWLGESYEGMTLQDAWPAGRAGAPMLELTYGQDEWPTGLEWVRISEYTESEWEERISQGSMTLGGRPGTTSTPVTMLGTQATLYERPVGQMRSQRQILAHLDGTVLLVDVNSGPPGSNPYRDGDVAALIRLAQSFRPFEQPAQ